MYQDYFQGSVAPGQIPPALQGLVDSQGIRGLHFVSIVPPGPHGHILFGFDDLNPYHDEIGFSFGFIKKLNPISAAKSIAKSPIIRAVTKPAGWVTKQVGKAGVAIVKSPITKVALTGAAFVCPAVGVPALAAVAMSDKLIDAARAASKNSLVKKATSVVGITGGISAVAAVKTAQAIATQAKANPKAAALAIKRVQANAKTGNKPAQATLVSLKTIGKAQGAANIVKNTATLAAKGDVDAKRALGVIKARTNERKAGKRFLFTVTPDGRIHHEPDTAISGDEFGALIVEGMWDVPTTLYPELADIAGDSLFAADLAAMIEARGYNPQFMGEDYYV